MGHSNAIERRFVQSSSKFCSPPFPQKLSLGSLPDGHGRFKETKKPQSAPSGVQGGIPTRPTFMFLYLHAPAVHQLFFFLSALVFVSSSTLTHQSKTHPLAAVVFTSPPSHTCSCPAAFTQTEKVLYTSLCPWQLHNRNGVVQVSFFRAQTGSATLLRSRPCH